MRKIINFFTSEAAIGIGIVLLFILVVGLFYVSFNSAENQIKSIENPIERGLTLVAVSVVFHAFFGGSRVTIDK